MYPKFEAEALSNVVSKQHNYNDSKNTSQITKDKLFRNLYTLPEDEENLVENMYEDAEYEGGYISYDNPNYSFHYGSHENISELSEENSCSDGNVEEFVRYDENNFNDFENVIEDQIKRYKSQCFIENVEAGLENHGVDEDFTNCDSKNSSKGEDSISMKVQMSNLNKYTSNHQRQSFSSSTRYSINQKLALTSTTTSHDYVKFMNELNQKRNSLDSSAITETATNSSQENYESDRQNIQSCTIDSELGAKDLAMTDVNDEPTDTKTSVVNDHPKPKNIYTSAGNEPIYEYDAPMYSCTTGSTADSDYAKSDTTFYKDLGDVYSDKEQAFIPYPPDKFTKADINYTHKNTNHMNDFGAADLHNRVTSYTDDLTDTVTQYQHSSYTDDCEYTQQPYKDDSEYKQHTTQLQILLLKEEKQFEAEERRRRLINDVVRDEARQGIPGLSAGALLNKTHEELVLLLIQLRRQHSALQQARKQAREDRDSQVIIGLENIVFLRTT